MRVGSVITGALHLQASRTVRFAEPLCRARDPLRSYTPLRSEAPVLFDLTDLFVQVRQDLDIRLPRSRPCGTGTEPTAARRPSRSSRSSTSRRATPASPRVAGHSHCPTPWRLSRLRPTDGRRRARQRGRTPREDRRCWQALARTTSRALRRVKYWRAAIRRQRRRPHRVPPPIATRGRRRTGAARGSARRETPCRGQSLQQ